MSTWYEIKAHVADPASKYAEVPATFVVKAGNPLAARAAVCRFHGAEPEQILWVTEITDPARINVLENTTL